MEWEVIAGNIGSVYLGLDRREAFRAFEEFRGLSMRKVGSVGGQGVVLVREREGVSRIVKLWEGQTNDPRKGKGGENIVL